VVAATLAHDTLLPAASVGKLDEDFAGASSAYDDSLQIEHSAMRLCLEPLTLASAAFAAAAVACVVVVVAVAAVGPAVLAVAAVAAVAVAVAAAFASSSVCDWPCFGHRPVAFRTYPE